MTADASNFQLDCATIGISVDTSTPGSSNCTLSGVSLAPDELVTVSLIAASQPTGWTIIPNPASGTLSGSSPFQFTLSLVATCAADVSPPAPNVEITSLLSFSGTSFSGPSTTMTVRRATASTVSASITSGSLTWTLPYSFAVQDVSGSLTYQVMVGGCAGWSIQISASNFGCSGAYGGTAISNANIALTSTSFSAITGSTADITIGAGGPLSSSLKMLIASSGSGTGNYAETLGVEVSIPGGTRAGTYTSTITIAVASGP